MVKVSITLPNNAQITFEAEEPEVIHEIVGMVLRDLPRELMQASVQVNGSGERHPEPLNGHGNGVRAPVAEVSGPSATDQIGTTTSLSNTVPSSVGPKPVVQATAPGEASFVEFCQMANPMGDMRRVVVAAEGARQYLGAASVDADELGRLFDLAGWPRPHSFVQTLRNAARSKFRWLERVPGRSGCYTVTELGRRTALGD